MSVEARVEALRAEIEQLRSEQRRALDALASASGISAAAAGTDATVTKARKKKSNRKAQFLVAALLALAAIFFPNLYELCPVLRSPPPTVAASAAISPAASAASTLPPSPPSPPSPPPQPVTFVNGVDVEYYAFESDHPLYTVKRVVTATIHAPPAFPRTHAAVFPSARAFIAWMRSSLDARPNTRSDCIVHLEVIVLPTSISSFDAAPSLAAFAAHQDMLGAFNAHCESARLEVRTFGAQRAAVHVHMYSCDRDFITMPADAIGSKECTDVDGHSAFCASNSLRPSTSRGERVVPSLDMAALDRRTPPADFDAVAAANSAGADCMLLNASANERKLLHSMRGAPFFEHLPSMSTVSVLSRDPPVYLLENFLNATEIAHVRALGIERLAPSEGVGTTAAETLEYRSSSSAYFSPAQSRIVEAIEERALRVTGAPLLEPLQVVQYVRGQRYDAHFDYFDQLPGSAAAISVHGQRTHTLFVYLDSVPAVGEGETSFPLLAALRVHPRRGAALLWSNVLPSGVEDARTLHAGLPVVGDFVKIAMNVWTTDSVLVGPVVPCPPPPPSAPIDEV